MLTSKVLVKKLKRLVLVSRQERSDSPTRAARGRRDQGFGSETFAQYGEDLIVANIFAILGIKAPTFLDIGAHHPFYINNTALLYQRGSRGINVEANPILIEAFYKERPLDTNLNVGVAASRNSPISTMTFYMIDDQSGRNTFDKETAEAFVRANPTFSITKTVSLPMIDINTIITTHAQGRWPNFLSIDIEGWDLTIIADADFSLSSPDVICVESISGDGNNVTRQLVELLEARAYVAYARTVANIIFVQARVATRIWA